MPRRRRGVCCGCDGRHWLPAHRACYKGRKMPRGRGVGAVKRGLGSMAFPVRTCALVGRFADPRIAESVGALLPHLASRGVQVLVSQDAPLGAEFGRVTRVPEDQIAERAELVIAVGGDGTLLYAARLVARHSVPLIGVNRGRLGFLT